MNKFVWWASDLAPFDFESQIYVYDIIAEAAVMSKQIKHVP